MSFITSYFYVPCLFKLGWYNNITCAENAPRTASSQRRSYVCANNPGNQINILFVRMMLNQVCVDVFIPLCYIMPELATILVFLFHLSNHQCRFCVCVTFFIMLCFPCHVHVRTHVEDSYKYSMSYNIAHWNHWSHMRSNADNMGAGSTAPYFSEGHDILSHMYMYVRTLSSAFVTWSDVCYVHLHRPANLCII